MNTRIAKLFADFGFFEFGKFHGSLGDPSPLYVTSKRLYSQPDKMAVLSEEIIKFTKGKKFDIIAGSDTSGTPLAVAVSLAAGIPFVYTRRRRDKKGDKKKVIEGLYRRGERALVVDDGIGTGQTKVKFITRLKRAGIVVKDVLVLYDAGIKHMPYYQKNKIRVHSFVQHNDLVKYMRKNGYISRELSDYMIDIWKDLKGWQDDGEKWKKFVGLAKKEGFRTQNES